MLTLLSDQQPVTAIAVADSTSQVLSLWLYGKSENTQQAYRRDTFEFLTYLAGVTGKQEINLANTPIRLNHLVDFSEQLHGLGRAKSTVTRKMAAIKSLLTFMFETGLSKSNAGKMLKTKRRKEAITDRILPRSQVLEMIYSTKNQRDRVALQMLYRLGLRASELTNLKWENISKKESGDALATIAGKGNKTRTVIIPKDLFADLLSLKQDDSQVIFHSRKKGHGINRQTLTKIVKGAAQSIGLQGVSAHWLRHCHVSHSLEAGAPISVVQKTVGHSSLTTTELYIHANPTDCSSKYL